MKYLILTLMFFASSIYAIQHKNVAGTIENIWVNSSTGTSTCVNDVWIISVNGQMMWADANNDTNKNLLSAALTSYTTGKVIRAYYYDGPKPNASRYICTDEIPMLMTIKFE